MANANTPRGLEPVRYVSGSPYNGASNVYFVPSSDNTAIYIGGLVKLAGGGSAEGIPTVTGNVSSGNPVVGVVTGFKAVTQESPLYRPASTDRYVYVADDPDLLFEAQEDGVSVTTVNGATAQLSGFTSGSTVTGKSSVVISTANIYETSDTDDDVRLVQFVQRSDNEFGLYGRWLVRLNVHQYKDSAVGV